MSSISQCQMNIQRYNNMKSKIRSIISKLSLAVSNTDDISIIIKNKYQVNDSSTPIDNRVINLKGNIENTIYYLNNKVIPAIDFSISRLYREIAFLEEQRRREEAMKNG